MVCSLADLWN